MASVIVSAWVLDHANRRQSKCEAWGERVNGTTYRFDKITCSECDGHGAPKDEQTLDDIQARVQRHAAECQNRYARRAYRCTEADRKGDRFNCPAALHRHR